MAIWAVDLRLYYVFRRSWKQRREFLCIIDVARERRVEFGRFERWRALRRRAGREGEEAGGKRGSERMTSEFFQWMSPRKSDRESGYQRRSSAFA